MAGLGSHGCHIVQLAALHSCFPTFLTASGFFRPVLKCCHCSPPAESSSPGRDDRRQGSYEARRTSPRLHCPPLSLSPAQRSTKWGRLLSRMRTRPACNKHLSLTQCCSYHNVNKNTWQALSCANRNGSVHHRHFADRGVREPYA